MNKTIFLDRDGVICKVEKGKYITGTGQLEILPEVVQALKLFKRLGFLNIVVTNQLGISLGYATLEDVEAINEEMKEKLRRAGGIIDDIFIAPNMGSFRKPALGMFVEAVRKWDIDLGESYMIGDSLSDMMAAENLGCRKILVKSPLSPPVAETLWLAANMIENKEISLEE